MKEFVFNKVAGFQALTQLKINFSAFTFKNFINYLETPISRTHFNGSFLYFLLQFISSVWSASKQIVGQ